MSEPERLSLEEAQQSASNGFKEVLKTTRGKMGGAVVIVTNIEASVVQSTVTNKTELAMFLSKVALDLAADGERDKLNANQTVH